MISTAWGGGDLIVEKWRHIQNLHRGHGSKLQRCAHSILRGIHRGKRWIKPGVTEFQDCPMLSPVRKVLPTYLTCIGRAANCVFMRVHWWPDARGSWAVQQVQSRHARNYCRNHPLLHPEWRRQIRHRLSRSIEATPKPRIMRSNSGTLSLCESLYSPCDGSSSRILRTVLEGSGIWLSFPR